jgi:hypothetical protein
MQQPANVARSPRRHKKAGTTPLHHASIHSNGRLTIRPIECNPFRSPRRLPARHGASSGNEKNMTHHPLARVLTLLAVFQASRCLAEFPALERVLRPAIAELAPMLRNKSTLVAVRNATGQDPLWRIPSAIQTELVFQLRGHAVSTTDAATEPEWDWLSRLDRGFLAAEVGRWRRNSQGSTALLGELRVAGSEIVLDLTLYGKDSEEPLWSNRVALNPAAIELRNNVPALNQKTIAFALSRIRQQVGDGECFTLASEALRHAGARRPGLYVWGRILAEHEPLLPGDVLQFERVRFQADDGSRRVRMSHHTALVETIESPHVITVLHQNFSSGDDKKTVTRYKLHLDERRTGSLWAFRPADNPRLQQTVVPRRRTPARVARGSDGTIDLLQTLDPELDSVHGLWHNWDGPLYTPRERAARLQIPVNVPESYVLRAEVTRVRGNGLFGLGLVVAGRQTLLAIDAGGGAQPGRTGLNLLDGKRSAANESTRTASVLPLEKTVRLECRVAPGRIALTAGDRPVIDWRGNARRLSNDAGWNVPNEQWLFLAAHESTFHIRALTLEPRGDQTD